MTMKSVFVSEALVFFVNGRKISENNPDPEMTLAAYLREKINLTGTKLGCGEGGCGACTVMVSSVENGKIRHLSVNSCLMPLVALHETAITTVEGIGSVKTKLHEVQKRLADAHGSQCGYCTPGIVMSMYTLLRNKRVPTLRDLEDYFQGNLCRCTGYRPIIEAYKTFTKEEIELRPPVIKDNNTGCCKNSKTKCPCKENGIDWKEEPQCKLFDQDKFLPYDDSQEPIFPPYLLSSIELRPRMFKNDRFSWYVPTSIDQILGLKSEFPDAKIVIGNTEIGIETKYKDLYYPIMIQTKLVPDLNSVKFDIDGVKIGASVTLSRLEEICDQVLTEYPTFKGRVFSELKKILRLFAGKQIRNVASIGGNIMTGSPISDLIPIFVASRTIVEVSSKKLGQRKLSLDSKFFSGYRKSILEREEVLLNIKIPFTDKTEFFRAYKQSRRREDDIAIVNASFLYEILDEQILNVQMAYGGVGPTVVSPVETIRFLKGKAWKECNFESAMNKILEDVKIPRGSPGGMEKYRQSLMLGFLYKSFLSISAQKNGSKELESLNPGHVKSHQLFDAPKAYDEKFDPVGKPSKHIFGDHHTTGEAIFTDDIPKYENELFLALVYSKKASAKIKNIDYTDALSVPGVVDFISSKDIPKEKNRFSVSLLKDELIFAENEVNYYGQIIGGILGINREAAKAGVKKVIVLYTESTPILTIGDAIEASSYHSILHSKLTSGDPEAAFKSCQRTVSGEIQTGAQEHFYLETQASLVVPEEEGLLWRIYSATQNPTETQICVANLLEQPMNKVAVTVRRIGGGFGGKETRSIPFVLAAAVGVKKYSRPVRVCLDRDEDMIMTGYRHPFLGRYKVGFDDDARIRCLDIHVYANAGWTMDLSFVALERAMLHCENSYKIENINIEAHCCKTNLLSNTAFRGFGGPQIMMIVECYIDKISEALGISSTLVRHKNLYSEGDLTYYGQKLVNCTLQRCWEECLEKSDYSSRRMEIEEFNRHHRWKKRGMCIIPTKYGIAFGLKFFNQAGALVHIYNDGSILLAHAGVEMGQGLHVKVAQVASKVLNVPLEKISVLDTSTDKIPNSSATAASVGSDLNGMAILRACETIKQRLQPISKKYPNSSWEERIKIAYESCISLSATGHYFTPDIEMNWETGKGTPYNYYTYGVGCSSVEVDLLTGDHIILRTDIVMDLGESLNPAIDIGQIEGAFTQGYGLFVMEQLLHSSTGELITRGPGNYKIPGFGDIPLEFNVSLLRGSSNPRAVYSSKAVGEPPLFLASSVYFAIKDALKYAKKENDQSTDFTLEIPATSEKIRLASEDWILQKIPPSVNNLKKPWSIQV